MANLTGRQIVEQGIVTKVDNAECIQQVGVDLELIKVEMVIGRPGIIPKEGKTTLIPRIEVPLVDVPVSYETDKTTKGWFLQPGSYDITLKQGCSIPVNQRLKIVQRSSLLRNAGLLASSMFDPNFKTENIGTVMEINEPIYIHYEARVAQAYVTEMNEVLEKDLYTGQWQGDKQRESQK